MNQSKLFLWSITAALAGFLFGFDTIVISGAEQAFQKLWQLNEFWHGLATGMALWGTVIGAIFGGYPASKFGRRRTLIFIGVLYFVSAVGSALAPEVLSFMFARFIGGLGVGAATVAAPMFISEIAPPGARGKLAGMFQFNIVLGILIALVSNTVCGNLMEADSAWRWMLGIEAIPAFIYTVMTFVLPESPRWLITHAGRVEEGAEVFRQINPSASEAEIQKLVKEVQASRSDTSKPSPFWSARLRFPILLAFLIAFFNQFSGINIVFYFAPRLLGLAGLQNPLLAAVALGVTNLVFTFVGLWLIDRLGRRSLLYIGSFGYILSLGICAWAFFSTPTLKVASAAKDLGDTAALLTQVEQGERYIAEADRLKLEDQFAVQKSDLSAITAADWYEGDAVSLADATRPEEAAQAAIACQEETSQLLGSTGLIVLVCLIVFIAAHAIGQGTVIWVFISEIFPNEHRAAGQALGSSTHWICAALITTAFPAIISTFEPGVLFAFLCGMMCLHLLWVKLMVPETKGVSLEDMQEKLGIAPAPQA